MKNRNIAKILFSTSLVLIVITLVFKHNIYPSLESIFKTIGICESYLGDHSCYNWSWLAVDTFLFLFINFIFLSIFLFFINQESLVKWVKFSRIAIPVEFLLLVLFILGYEPSAGTLGAFPGFSISPTFIIIVIFSIINLFLFIKNRKQSTLLN